MSSIMKWSHVRDKVPWGIIFQQGAWNVIAEVILGNISKTDLYPAIRRLHFRERDLAVLIIVSITWLITQFCDTISLLEAMFKIENIVLKSEETIFPLHPIYVFLPVSLISRMTYLFPLSKTCSMLVSQSAHIKNTDFFVAGIFPSVISFIFIYIEAVLLIKPIFNVPDFKNNKYY